MNKSGIVVTVGIVLLFMGMKFNSMAMNRASGNGGLMTSSGLSAVDRALLNAQIKQLDAQIAQKEQELEKAGRFEEYAVAKELNALRKKRADVAKMLTLDVVLAQPELRKVIPAKQCKLRADFIESLYFKRLSHDGRTVYSVAWSPDGSKLATGSYDHTAKIWDATTGAQIGPDLQHGGSVKSVAWSPDGSKLATGSNDCTAKIWDATTGVQIGPNFQHAREVYSVAWSPDESKLATGSEDYTAKIWNVVTGAQIGPDLQHGGWVTSVAWSPDGTKLATGSDVAKIWDVASGVQLFNLQQGGSVKSVAWSPDGTKLGATGGSGPLKIYDTVTGALGLNLRSGIVASVAWSHDGSKLATGSWDNTARIWDAATGLQIGSNLQHNATVYSVAWNPDGIKLLTGSADGYARIWDVAMIINNEIVKNFLANLNIDQCELLQALDIMVKREELKKPLMPIELTDDQWHTFMTFPKAVQDVLRLYIKKPGAQAAPTLSKTKQKAMDKRIGKKLNKTWAREEREAQK